MLILSLPFQESMHFFSVSQLLSNTYVVWPKSCIIRPLSEKTGFSLHFISVMAPLYISKFLPNGFIIPLGWTTCTSLEMSGKSGDQLCWRRVINPHVSQTSSFVRQRSKETSNWRMTNLLILEFSAHCLKTSKKETNAQTHTKASLSASLQQNVLTTLTLVHKYFFVSEISELRVTHFALRHF